MNTAPSLSALVELVRLPAVLSVPGDVVLGAAVTERRDATSTVGLAASSSLLYLAGMALNDYADREVDAHERPHRPIPSGRVRAGTALGVAGGLTAAALALSALAGGRRSFLVTLTLTGTVWAYDLRLKEGAAAVPAMAAARGLDVLVGASSGALRRALPSAAMVATHTALVTTLSRMEVDGADADFVRAVRAGHLVTAFLAAIGGLHGDTGGSRSSRLATTGLLAAYALENAQGQTLAAEHPTPANLQKAVGRGVLSLVLLQAALLARARRVGQAAFVAAAWPASRMLARRRAVS